MLVVSPQTQAMERRADVRGLFTVCVRCAQANIPGERIKAVPGAVDAFAQAAGISAEAAEAVVRLMGDIPIGEHDADLLDGPEDV